MDSTQALWFSDSRNWIPDSLFVELGFPIPNVSGIPDSFGGSPDSKARDSGFYKQKSPWNPESRLSFTGRQTLYFITSYYRLRMT